jgi:DNA ligase-1
MNLPKLFKKTATGAIQGWQIVIVKDTYYIVSGQVSGRKVRSEPTTCLPKNIGKANETTGEEQAKSEAQSKWQKKVDAGYVTTIEASKTVSTRVFPMLAKDYEDYKEKLSFPVFSQPKLDGLRVVVTKDGAFSRLGKPFATLDHIRELLRPIFQKYPEIVAFDGEIYSHELNENFEQIVSIVKQSKPTKQDIDKCKSALQYHIYDMVSTFDHTFETRMSNIRTLLIPLKLDHIRVVSTKGCESIDELDTQFSILVSQGYEGQMIRNPYSKYQQKRTKDLLKRKTFMDAEYRIVGFKEGKGNRKGCIVLQLITSDGKEFDSVPVGGVDYLQKLWQHRGSLIGLYATVKFQNLTEEGIPRFNNTIKVRDKKGEEVRVE